MKSEAEIRKAMRHLLEAQAGAILSGDLAFNRALAATLDGLRWCVGDSSEFGPALDQCDEIDAQHGRAAVN